MSTCCPDHSCILRLHTCRESTSCCCCSSCSYSSTLSHPYFCRCTTGWTPSNFLCYKTMHSCREPRLWSPWVVLSQVVLAQALAQSLARVQVMASQALAQSLARVQVMASCREKTSLGNGQRWSRLRSSCNLTKSKGWRIHSSQCSLCCTFVQSHCCTHCWS